MVNKTCSWFRILAILISYQLVVALSTKADINSNQPDRAETFLQSEALRKALLSQDWETVIKSIPNDSTVARDSRVMLLLGHACYGLEKNNVAAAIFTLISDSISLVRWEKWTAALNAKNVGSPVAHYLYGDALARNEKFDLAIKELNEAIKQNEKFCLALNARGAIYDITGDLNKASDDFEAVVEYYQNFADAYASIGVLYLQRSFAGAVDQFVKAIEKDSTHALAYNGQACYYASKGDMEKSRRSIIQANKYLQGNPYIVINAKAFTSSTDTSSALGKIAKQKIVETHRGVAQFAYNLIPEIKIGTNESYFKWSKSQLLGEEIDALPPSVLRGGIYFDIKKGENLEIINTESRRTVMTDFTLGYPRTKVKM